MAVRAARKQPGRRGGPGRPFRPGQSGNPAGRPPGRGRNQLIRAEIEAHALDLVRSLVEAAKGGDVTAATWLLGRLVPPAREALVDLPNVAAPASPADLPGAVAALFEAVAGGELAPAEGERMAALLDKWRAAVELADVEERLAALERSAGVGR